MSTTFKKFKVLSLFLVVLLITSFPMRAEASGNTKLTRKTSGTVYYVALGDSISSGTDNASLLRGYSYGYVNVFKSLLQNSTGKRVILTNRSVPGHDSTDLLNRLGNDKTTCQALCKANIITISIGGNNVLNSGSNSGYVNIDDAKATAGVNKFCSDLPEIIARINIINPSNPKILIMNLYNTYNPLEWGSVVYSDGRTPEYGYMHDMIYEKYLKKMMDTINDMAEIYSNVRVVDTYGAFENGSRFTGIKTITDASGHLIILSPYYASKKTTCTDKYTNFYRYPYRPLNTPYWRDPHPTSAGHRIIAQAHFRAYSK